MRVLNLLLLGGVVAAAPVAASAWQHEIIRGLDFYQVRGGGMAVQLVCDPRSVYGGTTETALLLNIAGNVDATAPVTFRFPDGTVVQAALVHGRYGKAEAEAGAWEALLGGFRSQGSVTVEVSDQTREIDLGEPAAFTCT